MAIGIGAALALGGMNFLGSMYAGNQAANASAAAAQSANFRNNQNILAGRWNAKLGSGMQMWMANQQPRLAKQNLAWQKDAAKWDEEVLGPLKTRGLIDRAERLNIFENSPENTTLRKKKAREGLAGRMLEANSQLSGLFGPSLQDKQYQGLLGFFG